MLRNCVKVQALWAAETGEGLLIRGPIPPQLRHAGP